jgi:hypothetical protein
VICTHEQSYFFFGIGFLSFADGLVLSTVVVFSDGFFAIRVITSLQVVLPLRL